MSYTNDEVSTATTAMDNYRADKGEIGAALVVVALSADRASKEKQIRDDMIVVAHRVGASIRQIADAAGLDRKTVANITAFENEKK